MSATTPRMKELMKKKNELESSIKELHELLDSQKGVGTDGILVDNEDFPRADIDVYSVRHARRQLACFQNDHKDVMLEIENELYRIHAAARQQRGGEESMDTQPPPSGGSKQRLPFAVIDRVEPGSPAQQSGLDVGDEVVLFGSISAENFDSLQTIGALVQHSKGNSISLTVLRKGQEVRLSLTPQTWSGRGLLGCNIVPVKR
ncbi:26S proteasome non-ATPase regulatory subunit 9-like [Gigantopelta aegis]|uniref:26S proteasome non-ATPase regulatory subunit 9-like n=1 Tax=Gigantopelta aegis TaxID=1735272 RepID=UPI001B88D063|nr:26S proteasome non-ATPase regulatory subunit 9-like [Gigantopelta aegis]